MKFQWDIWQVVTLIALLMVAATLIVRPPRWRYLLLSLAWTISVVIKAVLITIIVNTSSGTVAVTVAALSFLALLVSGALFDRRGRFVFFTLILTAGGIVAVDVWTLI